VTPEQFAYWLQGYAEMGGPAPSEEQWAMIKAHLALVFDKQVKISLPSMEPAKYPPIPFSPEGGFRITC
jgi:hypothetical protein